LRISTPSCDCEKIQAALYAGAYISMVFCE
jgi:hypothetical protein